jgi:type I restriction enzyme S subunit
VVEIIGGGTPPKNKPAFYGGPIPWATVRDMNVDVITKTDHSITQAGLAASSSKVIPAGEVVIASRVGLGKVCILGQDTAINQDLRGLVPKKSSEIDRRFLFHWYKSAASKVVEAGTGATVQGVTLPFLKSLLIPLPPLEEQHQIVAVLDEAFEGLARARAHAEANLRDARELLLSIARDAVAKHDAETFTLGSICEIYQPKTISSKEMVPDGMYVVYGANGPIGRYDKYNHEHPQLLVTCRGATCGSVNVSEPNCWITGNAMVVRPTTSRLSVDYLEILLRFAIDFSKIITGAAQPQITRQSLAPVKIQVPSIKIQDAAVAATSEARSQCHELELRYTEQRANLDALRQSLLQKAFAGELT